MEDKIKPTTDLLATEQLEVDEHSGNYLKDAGVWAKAVAIILFIIGGLALVGIVFYGTTMTRSYTSANDGLMIGIFIGVLLVGSVAAIAIVNLLRFNNGMATGISNQDAPAFEKGLTGLKYYFIFIGIVTLLFTFISLIQLIR